MTTSDLMTAIDLEQAEGAPLSFAQERIWYLDRVGGGGSGHHVAFALRLRGPLDDESLAWSLDELRRRHPALRSGIRVVDGEPRQVVTPFRPRPLPREDLRSEDGTCEEEILGRVQAEVARDFDIASGETTRWLLLRIGVHEHVLVLTSHHAFVDGSSFGLLLQELEVLYGARLGGVQPLLPPTAPSPAEHAVRERDLLDGERMEELLAYWRSQLGSRTEPLELPLDHARPPLQRFRGSRVTRAVEPSVADRVAALAREEGATPFMVVMAAFKVLLARYSGRTDMVIGTVSSGRTRPELHRLVGCLINTLAVCTDLSGDPSFRDALRRTVRSLLGALKHQDAPFERVVQALRPERSPSRMPLVQVLCRTDIPGIQPPRLPGIEAELMDIDDGSAYCDLDLSVAEAPEGLRLSLIYDRDLFDPGTVERMVDHLEVLLRGATEDPERPLSRLPLLTGEEWERMIVGWNRRAAAAPTDATVHGLLRTRAERAPDRVVVEDTGGGALDQRALHARSDAVARTLRAQGAGPGRVVGVCADRTVDLVVALLGVLKSGAAYLPLDPDYPEQRLAFMLRDAGAGLVLTAGGAARRLPASGDVRVLTVEDAVASDPGGGNGERDPGAGPDDPAYLIYTSGSTGTPKGVVVPHRAAASFLATMADAPGIGPDERLLAVTTTAFDIAFLELFLPLSVGATTVVAGKRDAADARRLSRLLEHHEITVMQATPATWRMLVDAGWSGDPPLRVLCGGEAMSADLAAALLERSAEVWNLYGPTEATVWCTRHRVQTVENPVSIGRPIGNARAYVLDGDMNPLPIGATGELWIGGPCVALGYHGREDLTAERFVPDPFSDHVGARLYRTGDLACWRPDGLLAYKGRRDHQVKLRGFRIELGEVEAALQGLSEIRSAVAAVTVDPLGERRLVAWVVSRKGRSLTGSEVRRRLRDTLPSYLIPSLVVELDELPLTPNGKVDRKALPDPLQGLGGGTDGFEPPSTALEKKLARIWSEVLGVDRVSAGDNFFDLGGHSLLCMRTVHRMEAATGLPFDPRTMVLQTLRQIACSAESPS